MFNIQELFYVFKPIVMAFDGIWSFLNQGMWDAISNAQSHFPFMGKVIKWFVDIVAGITGLDEWLNQFTVLNFSIGSGLVIIIIVTIIGWLGDKVGL